MKTIRFKNDWRYSRKGDVIEEGDGVAQILIARGIAEEVEPKEAVEGVEQTEDAEDTEGNDVETDTSTETDTQETNTLGSAQEMRRDSALPDVHTRRVPGPNETTAQSAGPAQGEMPPLSEVAAQSPNAQRRTGRGGRG